MFMNNPGILVVYFFLTTAPLSPAWSMNSTLPSTLTTNSVRVSDSSKPVAAKTTKAGTTVKNPPKTTISNDIVSTQAGDNTSSSQVNSSVKSVTVTRTPLVTTPAAKTTPAKSTPDPRCEGKESWNQDIFEQKKKCITVACTEELLDIFDLYMKCNSWKSVREPQYIAGTTNEYIMLRAKQIHSERKKNVGKARIFERSNRDHFQLEYGFVRKRYFLSYRSIEFTTDRENFVYFPQTELENDDTVYIFALFKDLYRVEDGLRYIPENTPLSLALANINPATAESKEGIVHQLNSHIIVLLFEPAKKKFKDYVTLDFKLRDSINTKNHKCNVLDGRLGIGFWTDAGCHVYSQTSSRITCKCTAMVGTFAVVSEYNAAPNIAAKLQRDSLTIMFLIISCVAMGFCFMCLLLPRVMGCTHLGGLLYIYKYADMTTMLTFGVFLCGVYNSDQESKAQLIAALLNFLHHANMMWVIIEGVHIYHGMNPLYADVVSMMFFYSTLAFGVAAAVAGSAAGYKFKLNGSAQYIWPYAEGVDMMYFLVPTIIMVVIVGFFIVFLIYELMSWIGNKDDYLHARAVIFIKRNIAYILVFTVTHAFGVSSMARGGSGSFAYFFMGALVVQIVCVFYNHFISNYEVWDWKDQQEAIKELMELEALGYLDDEEDSDDDDDFPNDEKNDLISESNGGSHTSDETQTSRTDEDADFSSTAALARNDDLQVRQRPHTEV